MKKNYKKILFVMLLAVLTLATVVCSPMFEKQELDKDEVQALRKDYPFYDDYEDTILMSVSPVEITVRDAIKLNDTFVYAEVVDAPIQEKVVIDNGLSGIDKVEQEVVRYQYPIKVISDTEGLFTKGQIITYCYGIILQDYCPSPKIGEKIIIPISVGLGDNEGVFYSDSFGYYSITSNGYAMSAFRERGGYNYSGKKAENLMKELVKSEEENTYYIKVKAYEFDRSEGKEGFKDVNTFKAKVKNELVALNSKVVNSAVTE